MRITQLDRLNSPSGWQSVRFQGQQDRSIYWEAFVDKTNGDWVLKYIPKENDHPNL